ncbi:MAG: flagellar basal body L-ring protein FlgH [Bryobacteraceae bacterium]|jgi:flagellar L-ring protein precursor FlgH
MNHAFWILIPAALLGQTTSVQTGPTAGSLFSPTGYLADSGRDVRASRVDDVVTIVVSENVSAVASGVTSSSRKTSATSNITSLLGPKSATGALANLLGLSGDQEIAGTGQTTRTMTVSTTLSARVVDVRPNGTLVVEGTKEIGVNSEKQTITVHGLVRPEDLTTANTIGSGSVGNLQIHVNGKGVVSDAIKRPNFLYRLLLGLLPF